MTENQSSISILGTSLLTLFFFTLFVALFAWMTYGTWEGIIGMLAYLIVGLLAFFPWILPFIGIPLGILDVLGIYGSGIYQTCLTLARIQSSWMTISWYWIISIPSLFIGIVLSFMILSWIKGLSKRRKEPKQDYALVNCHIIDGNKDSSIIEQGIILIKNVINEGDETSPGTIMAVGKKGDIDIPPGFKKINLTGKYVLPGFINAHCHLTGSGKPMKLMNVSDEMMERASRLVENRLVKGLLKKLMKKNVFNALNAGVTTLRSMSDPAYIDVELRKEIEEGIFLGPRLIVAGKGICITGGHGGPMAYVADSIPEIRKAIRKNVRNEVDVIKILSTGGVMDARKLGEAGRPQMTIEEIETACFEAHRARLLVATHCESTKGMEEALKGGVDTIEHAAKIPDELIPLLKNNPKSLRGHTYVVPTISAGMGLSTLPVSVTKITPVKFENAKLIEIGMIKALQRAHAENLKIGVGTDAGVPYSTHYDFWKELKYYVKYANMTPEEAIFYATKNNAVMLGIDDITGSIEKGKSADLQVLPSDPLEDINVLGKVEQIFIRGVRISSPSIKKVKKIEKHPLRDEDLIEV